MSVSYAHVYSIFATTPASTSDRTLSLPLHPLAPPTQLDITVTPKQGRALFWANTLIFDPQRIDPRLVHESRPVTKGEKVAVNSWGHMYNYVIPNHWGCTGSFETL